MLAGNGAGTPHGESWLRATASVASAPTTSTKPTLRIFFHRVMVRFRSRATAALMPRLSPADGAPTSAVATSGTRTSPDRPCRPQELAPTGPAITVGNGLPQTSLG